MAGVKYYYKNTYEKIKRSIQGKCSHKTNNLFFNIHYMILYTNKINCHNMAKLCNLNAIYKFKIKETNLPSDPAICHEYLS